MSASLRGLRLNCILAPAVATLAGILAILALRQVHEHAIQIVAETARTTAIAGLARLDESGAAPSLAAWLAAHRAWAGVARCRLDGDQLVMLDASGNVPELREPPPELILAFQQARSWRMGPSLVSAAPSLPPVGQPHVIIAWSAPAAASPWLPWLVACGAVALIGGGLGWYLVARVYRPVLWLEAAAQAAAEGRGEPPDGADSPETASLRSSIATLIAKRRHSDGA